MAGIPVPLGARLKALRTRNRLSLQDVADATGISRSHVWNLETGAKTNPSVELLVKLARLFRVGIADLVGENPDESNEDARIVAMYRDLKKLDEGDQAVVEAVIDKLRQRRASDD